MQNTQTKHIIESGVQAFLDAFNKQTGPKIYELTPEQARETFDKLQTSVSVRKEPVDIEERELPVGPSGKVKVRILRPKGATGTLPVLMYFHGAGWVMGDYVMYERLVGELTNGSGAALVFVEFQRSPEAKYPTAIEEAYAATKWIAENGSQLNLDPSRLAVAGDSVGGNMAAVVAILAKERGGPKIGFQLLFYPVTNGAFDTPSYKEFADGHFLTLEAMKWFWNAYCPDEAARAKHTVSPLRATKEQLAGLPPALVINGECDVLRDEGEAYAHKLIEAGVPVVAVRFAATIHDFVMLSPIAETNATRGAIALAICKLKEFFGKK